MRVEEKCWKKRERKRIKNTRLILPDADASLEDLAMHASDMNGERLSNAAMICSLVKITTGNSG